MERSRRERFATHTVPLTWEIPVAAAAITALLILVTPLLVQGVVGWAVTGVFAWPTHELGPALLGLLHGRFGDGLAAEVSRRLPPDPVMWALTVLGEVVMLGAALVAGLRIRDVAGGSKLRHGLATSAQAAQALGLPRLRKTAAVVRPDLYARRPRSGRTREAGEPR